MDIGTTSYPLDTSTIIHMWYWSCQHFFLYEILVFPDIFQQINACSGSLFQAGNANRLACDCKLFVRRDNEYLYLRIRCGDLDLLAADLVLLRIDLVLMPRYSRLAHTSARTVLSFSPIPPVKVIASTPFMAAV